MPNFFFGKPFKFWTVRSSLQFNLGRREELTGQKTIAKKLPKLFLQLVKVIQPVEQTVYYKWRTGQITTGLKFTGERKPGL